LSVITKDIIAVAHLLRNEEVVAIPTETVYGLAGNIFSAKAISTIYAVKQRPLYNPLIVHLASIAQLNSVAKNIPPAALTLATKFWPGPLTMVLPKQDAVPSIVTSANETVAVRIPNHPIALELLAQLDFPIAAPSANPFNYISPTSAEHVQAMLGNSIPAILDGGTCTQGIESTIVGFDNDDVLLYRHGSISEEEIEQCLGKKLRIATKAEKPQAPGMLDKHYSPHTKLIVSDNIIQTLQEFTHLKVGLLTLTPTNLQAENIQAFALSADGNLQQAAQNLYATLHTLDALQLDIIIAELMPDVGLGKAINDKLKKAGN
jgi:L-threonylcarbamoyladenylate synthase